MSIFTRFTLRALDKSRVRTIVSIAGIALACALICAIGTSMVTIANGLYQRTLETEGSWQVSIDGLSSVGVEILANDSRTSALTTIEHYGAAALSVNDADTYGTYLELDSFPSSKNNLVVPPEISEGHAPTTTSEVVLPQYLKSATLADGTTAGSAQNGTPIAAGVVSNEPIQLGSTIYLTLGTRTQLEDATDGLTDSSILPNDPIVYESDNGTIAEYLSNLQPTRAFIVVGFYDTSSWHNSAGSLAFTAPAHRSINEDTSANTTSGTSTASTATTTLSNAPLTPLAITAFSSTNLNSYSDLTAYSLMFSGGKPAADESSFEAAAIAPEQTGLSTQIHDSLVRYQGMVDNRAIWSTIGSMVVILVSVVIVASISLIYNAFAISVSERTRQFGLLASLGASRRQLRRTVYIEAGILALIGIPLGLILGLMGTHVVFQLVGEGIAIILGTETQSIIVSPTILGFTALLTLITIAISAFVPAVRASHVSAVDAIRQTQDIKPSRRERRRQHRILRHTAKVNGMTEQAVFAISCKQNTSPYDTTSFETRIALAKPRRVDIIRLKLEGVSGWLAHRSLTRATSKGRVAVISLAVSVALLVISGTFGSYMEVTTGVIQQSSADLMVSAPTGRPNTSSVTDYVQGVNSAYAKLCASDGVEGMGFVTQFSAYAMEPQSMLNDLTNTESPYYIDTKENVYQNVNLTFLDETAWKAYLKQLGITNTAAYTDPAHPKAIALNSQLGRSNSSYLIREPFASTGTMTLFTEVAHRDNMTFLGIDYLPGTISSDSITNAPKQGKVGAQYQTFDENGIADKTVVEPLETSIQRTYNLEVGMLAEEAPEVDAAAVKNEQLTIYLPLSALPTLAEGVNTMISDEYENSIAKPFSLQNTNGYDIYDQLVLFFFTADSPSVAESKLQSTINQGLGNYVSSDTSGGSDANVVNYAEAMYQTRMMLVTVQTFTMCFAIICGLIAVANVFNTLSTSIILRRREFAMLKSVGMDNRMFYRMIARECASYAVRGLVIGLLLAAGVSFLLYQAMGLSFEGIDYMLPLLWIGIAIVSVFVVLIVSVIYALMHCRTSSVVQALREDII